MSHSKTSVLDSELFWESLTVGAFSLTILAYLRIGFVESFLPLVVGIYCLRRSFAVRVEGGRSSTSEGLTERYDVPEKGEVSDERRREIIDEVRTEYRKKRKLWGALTGLSGILALVAVTVTVAVTAIGSVIAGYCFLRRRHANTIVRYLDAVLDELPE